MNITEEIEVLLAKEELSGQDVMRVASLFLSIGFHDQASEWYKKAMGIMQYETEEYWYCLFQTGMCKIKNHHKPEVVIEAMLETLDNRPWRTEPVYYLMVYLRGCMLSRTAYWIGKMLGMLNSYPSHDTLHIEEDVYAWKFFDEYAINASLSGHKDVANEFWKKAMKNCPEKEKLRIESLIK